MRLSSAISALSCGLLATAEQVAVTQGTRAITLSPPGSILKEAAPIVDPAFAGFAFEARSFWNYSGMDFSQERSY